MSTPRVVFLDTNILLRHLLQDHPQQSRQATAFLTRVERGEIKARAADTVIFEAVFTLQRHYGHSKAAIRAALLPLIDLPGLQLPGKRHLHRVFHLYADENLPFADAYHAVLMRRLGLTEIATFDKHFDRIEGLERTALTSE